ncbi:hypothetical protein PRZ48_011432 [Zasmidium cellare]|uniref:Uncharacterized protein n=1 Tax=Zasmidium cellare TaxID=395010 RepID=A0ABR0E6B7_ZASCE|nr:hypothetical protein PRZ48_011432 [Zasmidium cellare]
MNAARFPALKISVLDTCVYVAESGARADVYVLTETTGAPSELRRQGLGVFKWRWREGRCCLKELKDAHPVNITQEGFADLRKYKIQEARREALRILGYERVHHGNNQVPSDPSWEVFNRAADATFATLPTYTGKPFTREEWDEVIQHWDVVTDMFAYYARSLIPAYPDAKKQQKSSWYSPLAHQFVRIVGPLTGTIAGSTSFKFITGWIGSNKRQDIFDKAEDAYVRHNQLVRDTVRPGQLLDYKLKDGWEPLCQFLGKDVPDVPFPRLNTLEDYQAKASQDKRAGIMRATKRMFGPVNRPPLDHILLQRSLHQATESAVPAGFIQAERQCLWTPGYREVPDYDIPRTELYAAALYNCLISLWLQRPAESRAQPDSLTGFELYTALAYATTSSTQSGKDVAQKQFHRDLERRSTTVSGRVQDAIKTDRKLEWVARDTGGDDGPANATRKLAAST